MIFKIGLGTVQFGQDYGIANGRGKVPPGEVAQILDYARSARVECLDTAFNYGESEAVIGEYLEKYPGSFKVVSKFSSLGQVEGSLEESLQRLRVKELYGYLLHRFDDIKESPAAWENVVQLKKQGKIQKAGFSLYSPEELVFLLDKKIDFDIVQVPFSIFDRRFEEYFGILKKKKVEIQARSVFLQGLFFMDPDDLPVSLQGARPRLKELQQIAGDQKISIEALCLNFVALNPDIDKVLIGVDSLQQLENNIRALGLKNAVQGICGHLNGLKVEDEGILLPYKWGKRDVKTGAFSAKV